MLRYPKIVDQGTYTRIQSMPFDRVLSTEPLSCHPVRERFHLCALVVTADVVETGNSLTFRCKRFGDILRQMPVQPRFIRDENDSNSFACGMPRAYSLVRRSRRPGTGIRRR